PPRSSTVICTFGAQPCGSQAVSAKYEVIFRFPVGTTGRLCQLAHWMLHEQARWQALMVERGSRRFRNRSGSSACSPCYGNHGNELRETCGPSDTVTPI